MQDLRRNGLGPDPWNLWLWRPDAAAVNEALKKIAILEHSRPIEEEDRESDEGTSSGTAAQKGANDPEFV